MIELLSIKITDTLISSGIVEKEDKEIYEYGTVKLLSCIATFGFTLLMSIFLQRFFETVLLLISFYPLRVYSGGYHAKTPLRCFISFQVLYLAVMFAFPLLHYWSWGFTVFSLALASFMVFRYAPINHPNMGLTPYEIRRARKISRIILLIEIVFVLALKLLLSYSDYSTFVCMGILLTSVLMISAKIKKQEVSSI